MRNGFYSPIKTAILTAIRCPHRTLCSKNS